MNTGKTIFLGGLSMQLLLCGAGPPAGQWQNCPDFMGVRPVPDGNCLSMFSLFPEFVKCKANCFTFVQKLFIVHK